MNHTPVCSLNPPINVIDNNKIKWFWHVLKSQLKLIQYIIIEIKINQILSQKKEEEDSAGVIKFMRSIHQVNLLVGFEVFFAVTMNFKINFEV